MYRLIRPALFRLDPEDAHDLTLRALALASGVPGWPRVARALTLPGSHPTSALAQTLWGQSYASPVGLAAGLDKNGVAVSAWEGLGFGFMEVGTVTPRPQPGNERPRLFRLPEDRALINRMGFNNAGARALAARLAARPSGPAPVWVNIGKNKDTPNEAAAEDYRLGVRALQGVADAFVVNVSSPNTPGLRALQSAGDLRALTAAVVEETEAGRVRTLRRPPVLVKLAPDLHPDDFAASVDAAVQAGAQGLIVSNTTLSRDGLRSPQRTQAGGLSGAPLRERALGLVRDAYRQVRGAVPVVGVGGIFTPEDAYARLRAGASLVEVYTGLIYRGPGLVRELNVGLARLLERDGVKRVAEVVGADA